MRLSLLCDSPVNSAAFLTLLYAFRDLDRRVALHVALEDLAIALHASRWFFNAPAFEAHDLRDLLWDPRVALFVYRGCLPREPPWAWAYRGSNKLTERVLMSTCSTLGFDRRLILDGYHPRSMRIGGAWEMRPVKKASAAASRMT